jgi:signal transduction histidine kinase
LQPAGAVAEGTEYRRYRHPPDGKGDPDADVGPRELAVTRRLLPTLRAGLSLRRRIAGALTGLVVLPLLTAGLGQLRDVLDVPSQLLFYLLVVVVVALVGGRLPALAAAVAAAALLRYYFFEPRHGFAIADPNDVVTLIAFLLVAGVVSSVVGVAARRAREAETLAATNAESREELRVLADEQAALRRVATLVAHGVPPADVFAAVAREVGHILRADATNIVRLDPDGGVATVLARAGAHPDEFPVGSRWTPEPPLALAVVLRTGRPARLDDFSQAADTYGQAVQGLGIRSGVAVPIVVEGHLWGAIAVGTLREPLPADTEHRMAGFTELVGTAIANAESHAQLEESRDELRRLAEEQAALRRVATLVARGVPADEVFPAVAKEVRHILGAAASTIFRRDPDGTVTVLARVGERQAQLPVGSRWKPEPPLAIAAVLRTGRAARCDDYSRASGAFVDATVRRMGIRSSVAAPIVVEGRLWGVIVAGTVREPLPVDAERRMAGFTELVGTAIANADSRAQLTASRARIVAAADDARRRIERDLHDGTQQRLVALGLTLRLAESTVPAELPQLQTQIGRVAGEITGAVEELREIARGIHPAILSEGGLGPALRTLARRAAIPVELDIRTETRPADPIEVAAYYIVSEALTNTTKHARASCARVAVEQRDGLLHLSIRDDGVGGADPAGGSGLIGLRDRVQALGGSIEVDSSPGEGTAIVVELPPQPG